MFEGKKILITGGCGMIGRELIYQLLDEGAMVRVADKNPVRMLGVQMMKLDLTDYKDCLFACQDMDYVFHLVGIKGNPKMTQERPVDFIAPMLKFDTNMITAAQEKGIKKFSYTSSIAVFYSKTDKYPAWAKKTAETLIDAMRIQYPNGTQYCITRPGNTYGKYDDFNKSNLMVIPSLIYESITNENNITIQGDGAQERDFINAKDVAKAMILVMKEMPKEPINIGSEKPYTIQNVAEIISKYTNKKIIFKGKNQGCQIRMMDINLLKKLNWKQEISLKEGIEEIIEYKKNGRF